MVNEQQLLDNVREFFEEVNKGEIHANDAAWKHVADPDNFVFTDGFGAWLGPAEACDAMNSWLQGRGMRMDLKDMKATLDWIPGGTHLVQANVTYRYPSEPLPGLGTSQQGAFFVPLDQNGKMQRVHNMFLGPDAERLRNQFYASAVKMNEGKKMEGGEEAAEALKKLVASIAYRDPKKFVEDMSDDAVFIDPVSISRGKDAIMSATEKWIAGGVNSVKPITDVVSLLPYSAFAHLEYDLTKMPEECPLPKYTHGSIYVKISTGSGKKLTRVAVLPYDEENLNFNPALINWLHEHSGAKAAA